MASPDRLRLPFKFDPDLLARDLGHAAHSGWIGHFVRSNYEGDWSAIGLRAVADAKHPIRTIYADRMATAFKDMPVLDGCPYFRDVIATFACPIRVVRLMRLTPGSIIKEHFDLDLGIEDGMARIHIPILTNRDVDFRLNGTRIVMEPGSAWYLRLSDPHSVANRGTQDRVHLVIDMDANDWLKNLLEREALAAAS